MFGQLSFSVDERIGVLRVTGSGMWSPELTERHFRNLDTALIAMRQRHGLGRTLVDLREASVQTAETAQMMKDWTNRIYRPVDRAAVVCGTALLGMQIRRAAQVHQLATFLDPTPALAWLLSDAPARVAQRTLARAEA
jgi:hypothetical protein